MNATRGLILLLVVVFGASVLATLSSSERVSTTDTSLPAFMDTPWSEIPIERIPNLHDGSDWLYGEFDPNSWVVKIRTPLSKHDAWITFYHERYHALVYEAGIEIKNDDTEDLLAEMYAADQLRLMEHPELRPTH